MRRRHDRCRVAIGGLGAGEVVAPSEQATQAERRLGVAAMNAPPVRGFRGSQIARVREQRHEIEGARRVAALVGAAVGGLCSGQVAGVARAARRGWRRRPGGHQVRRHDDTPPPLHRDHRSARPRYRARRGETDGGCGLLVEIGRCGRGRFGRLMPAARQRRAAGRGSAAPTMAAASLRATSPTAPASALAPCRSSQQPSLRKPMGRCRCTSRRACRAPRACVLCASVDRPSCTGAAARHLRGC